MNEDAVLVRMDVLKCFWQGDPKPGTRNALYLSGPRHQQNMAKVITGTWLYYLRLGPLLACPLKLPH